MKHTMIKIYIFLACLISISLDAIPYRFTRLVHEKHGQIDKVVDFFYDFHADFSLSPNRPSARGRIFLKLEEQKLFDATSRGFISSLRQLDATTNQKIGLLWEYEPQGKRENIERTAQEKELIEKTGHYLFLREMGNTFYQEFAPENNKNIVFIPSDIYRKKEIADYFDPAMKLPDIPLQELLKTMIDVAKEQSPGDETMQRLRSKLSASHYNYLKEEWTLFQQKLKQRMTEAFIPGCS